MTIRAHVLQRGLVLVLAAALGGCVFMPLEQPVASTEPEPAVPDAASPRLPALQTRHYALDDVAGEMLGEVQVVFARHENTLPGIARTYNLGYEELRHANPGVDVWLPGEGTPIFLPTASLVPEAPREGIVINVASMRLLFYSTADETTAEGTVPRLGVTSHPIGIGREGWATPTGQATVTQKARDPTWYPPASVRAEHAANGDPLPSVVPPGPDNPLGHFAIGLSLPGYLIHGTNKPAGVGMRVSHGCIRLYPEDIEALFDRVPSGTPVHIVNQPVLAGWHDGALYLEVHPPLAEDERDPAAEAERAIAAALARAGNPALGIDAQAVARILEEQRGMPFPITTGERGIERYLAAARVVENTAPLSGVETAASLE